MTKSGIAKRVKREPEKINLHWPYRKYSKTGCRNDGFAVHITKDGPPCPSDRGVARVNN